ncbi:lectin-like [Littorina saxatilis]|uniref:C-type lectin domain-containing protein n=1 Tax=Littorina saxatilis TaxID=31220 RepID=A0AAN9GM15_9CAEN
MMQRIALIAAGLLLVQLAMSCRTGWTSYEDSCYTVITDKQSWTGAQDVCETLIAHLVTIATSRENSAVYQLVKNAKADAAWIGLHDLEREGHFQWVTTNREANYTNWDTTSYQEPNNMNGNESCVEIRAFHAGRWNDLPCSTNLPFVCESST